MTTVLCGMGVSMGLWVSLYSRPRRFGEPIWAVARGVHCPLLLSLSLSPCLLCIRGSFSLSSGVWKRLLLFKGM